tara:strand:+ start:815 stop:2035 length:1221 start_codon:yes stop_codon:yes gene_type:complete
VIKNNLTIENKIFKENLDNKFYQKSLLKFSEIIKDINLNKKKPKNFFNIFDESFKLNFFYNDLKKFKRYKKIAVIGMGGSSLGSQAIFKFLENKIKKIFFFFDDLDEEKINDFKKKENLDSVLFLIISKSGNTTETLTNFIFLNIIKKKRKNIIIISEKKDNALNEIAKKNNLFFIEHKDFIGGRFSVLSEPGIVPAYFMGINTAKLRKNIKKYLIKSKFKSILKKNSIETANLLYKKKINNLILLNYDPKLKNFLNWYQQLVAESLGKNGRGLLPLISSAPKDHHSLLQLYLDGNKNSVFYVFFNEKKSKLKLNTKKISHSLNYLHKKDLQKIKVAQKNALLKCFKKNRIPFKYFSIKEINEEILGELFSYFILETVISAKLININPFNQPAVEQVKIETKKYLK